MDSIKQQAFLSAITKNWSWRVSECAKQISRKRSKNLQNALFLSNCSSTFHFGDLQHQPYKNIKNRNNQYSKNMKKGTLYTVLSSRGAAPTTAEIQSNSNHNN